MGYGMRKRPRFEDGVTFDDDELDYRGFPNMTIEYELTEAEHAEIARGHRATCGARARRWASSSPSPACMPNGSSLHYMGTMRMGETDDGTSVADP